MQQYQLQKAAPVMTPCCGVINWETTLSMMWRAVKASNNRESMVIHK